jgi:hypothetical protein
MSIGFAVGCVRSRRLLVETRRLPIRSKGHQTPSVSQGEGEARFHREKVVNARPERRKGELIERVDVEHSASWARCEVC